MDVNINIEYKLKQSNSDITYFQSLANSVEKRLSRMNRNIAMIIAGVSTFIHACMTLYFFVIMIQISILLNEVSDYDDEYSSLRFQGGFTLVMVIIALILEIGLLIVSILLVLGIRKNNHKLMASWIYGTGVYTVLQFIGLVKGSNDLGAVFAIKVIIIIIHAAMWYPVFMYWRDMFRRNNPSTANAAYNSPGVVYTTTPGTWPQGEQNMPNCYPAPGYAPQPAYHPQMQPLVNPQLSSASYPRQAADTSSGAVTSDNPPTYDKLRSGEEGEPMNKH